MSGWGVGGRPRIVVKRRLEDYPPPTPQPTPCVLWEGPVDRDGYGLVQVDRKRLRAHRWAWEQVNGPIPPGKVVRHRCDNRPCIAIKHLELGTVADNNRDALTRGHVGHPPILAPSEVRRMLEEHEAGRSLAAIWRDWAQAKISYRGFVTTYHRAVTQGLDKMNYAAPEGHHKEAPPRRRNIKTPYGDWRNRGPATDPVRPSGLRPGDQAQDTEAAPATTRGAMAGPVDEHR